MSLGADEHRRIEADLIERDEQLSEILAYAAVGVVKTSLEGQWLWMNKAYCDLLGYSESELRTKTLRDVTQEDDWDDMHSGRQLLLAGEISTQTLEKRYVQKDGTIRWGRLHRSLVRDRENRPKYFVSVVEDITEKKEAERALWHSEERFRLASKATNDAIWDIDLVTGNVTWNETYSMLYGRPSETSDSWQWWIDRIHPEDREVTVGSLRAALSSRASSWTCEYRFHRADGNWANIYDRAYIARDASGNAWRLIGAMQDLTDRKQAEAALRESEERFRKIFEEGSFGMAIVSLDSRILDVNESLCVLLGYNAEEMKTLTASERTHPEDIAREVELTRQIFAGEIPRFRIEKRLIKKNGDIVWVDLAATVIKSAEGVPMYGLGIIEDITKRKLAEAELRESEERFRASEARLMSAQRLANLGSWERDDVTGSTEFSDEMLRILGMPANPPKTLAEFLSYVHSEDRKYVSTGALRARSTGELVAGEYRIIRADGEIRFVRSVLQAIRDEHGTVIRLVGATQDITDLKRTQQESAARQKLESLGTLTSGIAHDFNNLLGGVLAESELALAELDAGLRPREELGAIRDLALRGSEIVRQLMVYAGQERATVGPVDLSRIVREMIELLKVSVSKHALLETDLANDLPAVQADATQIRQIVMNLVTNASEAIGNRDGVIRIAASRISPDQGSSGEISNHLSGIDYVQLEISDTGGGMPPQVQTRVFDPFFTTKSAGHGLGLAIVDGIVRSFLGKIHLESELGKGTTFKIFLPCSEITPVPEGPSPVEEAARFSASATVLVVEDEDVLRQATAKALRRCGLEVIETANGSAAIEILRTSGTKIDVILLDMTIPGSSSREVATEYAKARPDAKVILTSAYSEDTARKTMSVPHVRAFIRKPFHLGVLVETLRNTLES